MAVLEEQLIFEQSRAGSLKEKLAKESEKREAMQGELDTTKQVCNTHVPGVYIQRDTPRCLVR